MSEKIKDKDGNFLYRNGLSIVFFILMVISLIGQVYTGWLEHNDFLKDYKVKEESLSQYFKSGHFIQATFENWESEFFQMALFVVLTIFLRQKGSSDSKECSEKIIDSSELIAKEDSPWSVRKGGFYLWFYKNSLTTVLLLLFLFSFAMHWYGSWMDFNEKQFLENKPLINFSKYIQNKKFWFESFQNWQSGFLSIFSIIFLSIYLRQIGSSQSKKVNDAHSKTGDR